MGAAIHGKGWASVSCSSPSLPLEAAVLNRCRPSSPHILRLRSPKPKASIARLCISNHRGRIRIDACLKGIPDSSTPSSQEASIDIKLPRRNLMVQFTCNACGERTQRTINRVAYERGTVFVQCAGCHVNHKLVDNLGLVVEYDLREDPNSEPGTD